MTRDKDRSNILIGKISTDVQSKPANVVPVKVAKVYESTDCICLEVRIPSSGYAVAGAMGCKVFLIRQGCEDLTVHVGFSEDDWILFCAEVCGRTMTCVYLKVDGETTYQLR